jgi:molecular chaperone GrpE
MMGQHGGFPGLAARDRRYWMRPEEHVNQESSQSRPREPAAGEPPAGAARVAALEAELADRDRRLREALARERQATEEIALARQRLERDARKEVERSRRDLVAALLPVLDDLDRAIDAARESREAESLVTGVEHVRSGFLDRLRRLGVERFDPTGQRFDPALHEAVSTVEPSQLHRSGLIVKTLRPGYLSDGEVVRPAQVIVAGPEPASWF